MKVQVNDAENSQKELGFELPYELFVKADEAELVKLMPDVKVPGFRPGKAPKDIIKKQYSHKIRANAIEKVINNAINEALTTNNIYPLSQPIVKDVVFEDEKPITFKAIVDVFPIMKIEKYSGFDIEKLVVAVEEADVTKALEGIAEKQVTYEKVDGRNSVIAGDIAVIDFLGKVDGVAFEGGTAENFSLNIGSGQFIPGFEDGVIGMKLDSVKDITVTFPADYGQPTLAGKDAVFTVTLHEIKEKVAPKFNDEFAKNIDPKSNSIDDLKGKIKEALTKDANNSTKYKAFSELLSKVVEANPFDVPFSFIKEQAERLAYNSMNQFYQMGLDPEKVGINFEMMVQRHIEQAKDQVKQALVIAEIAKLQNIVAEDADVDAFLAEHAKLQDRTVEALKAELFENNQLEGIKNDVLGEKVYDYLMTINVVTEKKITRAEFDLINAAGAENKKVVKPKKAKAVKADKAEEAPETEKKAEKVAKPKKAKEKE